MTTQEFQAALADNDIATVGHYSGMTAADLANGLILEYTKGRYVLIGLDPLSEEIIPIGRYDDIEATAQALRAIEAIRKV